jgi:hypothetical protein
MVYYHECGHRGNQTLLISYSKLATTTFQTNGSRDLRIFINAYLIQRKYILHKLMYLMGVEELDERI